MAKKKPSAFDLLKTKEELTSLLDNFSDLVSSGTADVRAQVLELIPAFYLLRKLGTNILPEGDSVGARERILIYLQKYPEKIISSDELLVVSGITDYQRRIRELRSEMGWPVLSGNTIKSMLKEGDWDNMVADVSAIKPAQYIFLQSGQDKEAAYRWKLSNVIRRKNISIKDKLLEFFKNNIGRSITGEELSYLAKDATEWARRVRELRTEEGWPVKTRNTGRPELPVGVYVFEEDKQAEQHDRKIEDSTRIKVLERDHFSCRKCGWNLNMIRPEDPRQFLELHHLEYHAHKGENSEENLITICNVHHDYIHKHKMKKDQVLEWVEEK
ncbi:HNH endonuclease [Mucilaginibacter sp. OK098]|uniref:HNH endonuclease n=1 Tax=Mucilaginibacter sp. OK098 TaxID=1855297 RepID=UPI000919CCF4|nr:HNH endonuclease [Mucilaginibacter sp. OK098]SHL95859.1 5-methylcytosine-specific restriction endonuclease McrA [Mucilaginibacter sp. OK098]